MISKRWKGWMPTIGISFAAAVAAYLFIFLVFSICACFQKVEASESSEDETKTSLIER